jgi:hypothetical protein
MTTAGGVARRRLARALIGFAFVILGSCRPAQGTGGAGREVPARLVAGDYTDSLGAATTVVPAQSMQYPLVRLSGFDRFADGRFAIGDVSESRVTLFGPGGAVIAHIGRKGRGPGEFEHPRYPRFGTEGRLVVADDGQRSLQVFDATGALQRAQSIASMEFVSGFSVLSDGRFLFAGIPATQDSVLALTDSSGKVIRRYLPIARTTPSGEPADPMWESLRLVSVAVRSDTAFVVMTISDSLWTVDLRSGVVSVQRLVLPGYSKPALPERVIPGPRGLRDWSSSMHLAVSIHATERSLFIPFVKGVLTYGDPTILAWNRGGSNWLAFETRRPLLHAGGSTVTVLKNPNGDTIAFDVYREGKP